MSRQLTKLSNILVAYMRILGKALNGLIQCLSLEKCVKSTVVIIIVVVLRAFERKKATNSSHFCGKHSLNQRTIFDQFITVVVLSCSQMQIVAKKKSTVTMT